MSVQVLAKSAVCPEPELPPPPAITDDWDTAQELIHRHGETAESVAATYADQALAGGADTAVGRWFKIAGIIAGIANLPKLR